MEVAKVFAISPVFSSEGGTSRGVPCVNCGHTRRKEPPLYPLPDRVEGVIVDVGWAWGLGSVSDCSPLAALRLWQRTPEGESSENSPRPPICAAAPARVYRSPEVSM
jgi:hypothetical protein